MRQRIAIAALCMAATQVSASTVVRYDAGMRRQDTYRRVR